MNHLLIQKNLINTDYEGLTRKIYLISDWFANTKHYLKDLCDNCMDYNNLIDLMSTSKLLSKSYLDKIGLEVSDKKIKIINIPDYESISIVLYEDGFRGEVYLNISKNESFDYDLSSFKDIDENDTTKQAILQHVINIYKKIYTKYFMS